MCCACSPPAALACLGRYHHKHPYQPQPPCRYEDQDLLQNRPPLQQALVISAGVIANVLLSFSLLFGTVATAGLPRPQFAEGPYVMKLVERDCPAAQAGIQPEDLILAVRGVYVCGGVGYWDS